jgi:hypothetical protein
MTYSYIHVSWLNDMTTGNNGECGTYVRYFCTADVGYDDPTGNGTSYGCFARMAVP